MEKILVIDNCADCKSFHTDQYATYCIVTDKKFDVDPYTTIPDWCPLEDAPQQGEEAP